MTGACGLVENWMWAHIWGQTLDVPVLNNGLQRREMRCHMCDYKSKVFLKCTAGMQSCWSVKNVYVLSRGQLSVRWGSSLSSLIDQRLCAGLSAIRRQESSIIRGLHSQPAANYTKSSSHAQMIGIVFIWSVCFSCLAFPRYCICCVFVISPSEAMLGGRFLQDFPSAKFSPLQHR